MKNNLQQAKHCPHICRLKELSKPHTQLLLKLIKIATTDRDGMTPDTGHTGEVSSLKAKKSLKEKKIPTIKLSDTVPSVG